MKLWKWIVNFFMDRHGVRCISCDNKINLDEPYLEFRSADEQSYGYVCKTCVDDKVKAMADAANTDE